MSDRPSRTGGTGPHPDPLADVEFKVEGQNSVVSRLPENEMPVSQIMSVRDEAVSMEPIKNVGNLVAGIAGVMAEIQPVDKGGWNKFHSYAYARIQDLLSVLTPLMGKHGIVIFQTEEGRELFDGGKVVAVRYRFTVVHKSGEVWPDRPLQTGLSNCRDTKGGFDDKALNKCHTAARKYFLLSLFQIPTEDMDDADSEGRPPTHESGKRPPGKRQVPSPNGKINPHLLPVIDGEAPVAWAMRFGKFVSAAESEDEVNRWYEINAAVFAKLKTADSQVYNDAIDYMDACVAKLAKPADPISTGVAEASDFPADKPVKPQDDGLDIPANLRRVPSPPKKPALTDEEREWIESLDNAFSGDEDMDSIDEHFVRLLEPFSAKFSASAVDTAMAVYNKNCDRIGAS